MYFLVLLLDVLGAVMVVAILRNFSELTLPTAIFFSLFPLGFAVFSEIIKLEALETGTSETHKNVTRIMGIMVVMATLWFGAFAPYKEEWNQNKESWVHPILVWYAVIAALLILIPIFKEIHERRKIQVDKLKDKHLL